MKEIQLTGTWQAQAADLNENFGEINTTIERLINEISGGDGSGTSLQAEELKKLIRGTSADSSAFTDPQVQLGEFVSVDDLNNTLNSPSLFSAKYCGRLRANLSGQNLDIFQFAVSHSDDKYAQLAFGNIVPANIDGESSRLALSSIPTARILRRISDGGVWGEWNEYVGGSSSGGGGTEIYGISAARSTDRVTIYFTDSTGSALTGAGGSSLTVTIPSADSIGAGFMSKADKAKLDSLSTSGGGGGTTEVFSVGKNGLVPAPSAAAETYLRSDGNWAVPASSGGGTTGVVTETANGLCPKLPEQSSQNTRYNVLTGSGVWSKAPWALPFSCIIGVSYLNPPDETKTNYTVVFNNTLKCFCKAIAISEGGYTYYAFSDNEMKAMPYQVPLNSAGGTVALPDSQLYICTGVEQGSALLSKGFSKGLYASIGGALYLIYSEDSSGSGSSVPVMEFTSSNKLPYIPENDTSFEPTTIFPFSGESAKWEVRGILSGKNSTGPGCGTFSYTVTTTNQVLAKLDITMSSSEPSHILRTRIGNLQTDSTGKNISWIFSWKRPTEE